ncbi:endonuclease [Flavobacterium chungangense]|uniref:Endonuclease I n=1 Tax=Flavobacterium chungangense TaxID=554283 RepID=A0A6V6YZZ0_9FLAO|nr:endonuclease [Flavobacterium chungangense]CAD0004889.1 endonuclease I [Flavobacterium chungangense]
MKKFYILFFTLYAVFCSAQAPANYYSTATGTGYTLKTQLYNIIKDHTDNGYSGLYVTYQTSDIDNFYENDGSILDMYSENPNGNDPYTYSAGATQRCGSAGYTNEGDCYNREHIIPQSVFDEKAPMVSDAHFITPTDGKVNGVRSNYPHSVVATPTETSLNGSKLGASTTAGYSGLVFEPIDEFKGDIARMYFYFATRYENTVAGYSYPMFNGSSNKVFTPAFLSQLLAWHNQDPVSAREIARNNAIYARQNNRNPYIDHPEYVAAVWTTEADDTTVPTAPTNLAVASSTSNSINLTWSAATDNVAVTGYAVYVNSVFKQNETGLSATITGLTPSTSYNFYVVARDASNNTSVPSSTVNGVTAASTGGGNTGSEIFFSEYIEGSSNNKILEISNFTGSAINLSDYSIKKQSNGAGAWGSGLALTGTINDGASYVIAYNLAATSCYNIADANLSSNSTDLQYNGNDPIGLFKNNVLIDIIGTFNGGSPNFAIDETLRRKPTVTGPNTIFNKSGEWDVYTKDTCSGLGSHAVTLSNEEFNSAEFSIYPNPVTHQFTINFKDSSDESFSIAIYSLVGQKVFERQNTNTKTVEVQSFSKGTYIIKITKDSKTLAKKLIIN